MNQRINDRMKLWALAIVIALLFSFLGKACSAEEAVREQITVNAPQAMQSAFEAALEDLELDDKYEIKFTNSEDANFTVTNQKSESNELIAYSPVIAVFNEDDELYQSYIEKEIFVPSDTEPEAYDFDFKKVMLDIIENPDSIYKVYYPDETMCDWSVFYAFLLYTANDGCYPTDGTNMTETKEIVDAFLQNKKTESISISAIDKIGGYAKNSIYLIPLADLGYIYENKQFTCRVMYPKTVVYCNYYASFDEIGKILYDVLEEDLAETLTRYGIENVGYYRLFTHGNYFVNKYGNEVSISYYDYGTNTTWSLVLRTNFNAVDVPEDVYFSK